MEQIVSVSELDNTGSIQNLEDYYARKKALNNLVTDPDEKDMQDSDARIRITPRGDSNSVLSLASRIKEMLMEELRAPVDLINCLEHPEEDLQFYCFDNNRSLCARCLATGACAGHQVISFRRAGGRIKRKVDELVCEIESRANLYDLWGKKVGNKKEDLDDNIANYKEQIANEMDEVIKKMELKKQELLKQADQMKVEKAGDFEKVIESMKNKKDEITNIGTIIKTSTSTLDEAGLCQYYSKKSAMIRSFLDEEEVNMPSDPNAIATNKFFQDRFSLSRFQEELQLLTIQLGTLSGIEDLRKKVDMNYYLLHGEERGRGSRDLKFSLPITGRESQAYDSLTSRYNNNISKPALSRSPLRVKEDKNTISPKLWDDKKTFLSSRVRMESKFYEKVFENKTAEGIAKNHTPSPKRLKDQLKDLKEDFKSHLANQHRKENSNSLINEHYRQKSYVGMANRPKLGIETNYTVVSPRNKLLEEMQSSTKSQDLRRLRSSMDFEKAKQELVSALKPYPKSSTLKNERNHFRSQSNFIGQPQSARAANNYTSLISQVFK